MKITDNVLPLAEWFQKLSEYLPATDVNDVKQAYKFAASAHEGQIRASGEAYITHSLTVAQMLSDLNLEGEVIVSGLLHDVPEDTEVTLKEISHTFGPTVAQLVDGVTKFKRASTFTGSDTPNGAPIRRENEQAENLRKMLLAMSKDVRVVLIKLVDRLHNMRTLGHLPEHKRQRIAQETTDIYAPLANRLSIDAIKSELEDRCFQHLHPQEYRDIARKLEENRAVMDRRIKKVAEEMAQTLSEAEIEATLAWRSKHFYSIYRKMQRKEVDVTQIYDVKALRIIVNSLKDCYAALGQVHSKWRPIAGEFDDYIAAPKENGYQSLHTAVVHKTGQQFEVQIRTSEMHEQAELGLAGHWRYKDDSKPDPALDQRIAAMRNAIRAAAEGDKGDASEFIEDVKIDVFEEKVYIFTPKGDIRELPLGSTPIDFAYSIHTEVGNKCRGAKINGALVGLDYQLKNSDKVEILAAKRGGPSRDWLNENLGYVKTSRARRKIKHWFKKQNYQESLSQGRSILERELKRLNITDVKYEDLANVCNYRKTDDFLAALGYDDLSIHHVIRQALKLSAIITKEEEEAPPTLSAPSPPVSGAVTVMGVGDLFTTMARCCNPVNGDPIIGYVTRGKGVTVHRRDCSNVLKQTDKERLIQVDWGTPQEKQTHPVPIVVSAFDRAGLIRDVSEIIANEQLNLTDIKVTIKDNIASVWLTIEVSDLYQLKKIMDKIEQLNNVIEVSRRR